MVAIGNWDTQIHFCLIEQALVSRYIPVKDLFNIYEEFYNKTVIDERTIVDCMYILFLQV